jgi:two-component system chemotaxis sensor kinase CheA
MTDALDVKEFLAGYMVEAEEHLSSANACLLALEKAASKKENDPRAVRDLFRNLHTLKGLSAMVGAEPIVDLAHEMESLLRSADRAGGKLPAHAIDVVFKGVRAIEERVANLAKGETLAPAPKTLLDALTSLHVEASVSTASGTLTLAPELLAKVSLAEQEQLLQGLTKGRRAIRVDFLPSEAKAAQGLNITAVRERMGKIGEVVKVLPRSIPGGGGAPSSVAFVLLVLTDAPDAAIAEAAVAAPADVQAFETATPERDSSPDESFDAGDRHKRNVIRVDVSRLDDALERLSALVVTRSRLQRALGEFAAQRGSFRDVLNIVAENGRQLRDLRGAITRARMVPVAELLERTPLLVRGVARSSKKLVKLTVDAGNSELDKAVADRLFPAIVHLLRNAVDHAIERPEERRSLGKPEEGHVQVTCFDLADNRLELVVADDGRGVDGRKVAARAGTPVPESDDELLALLARPGLSTLDVATQTSGRGFGMDIVKRVVVEELGGELHLQTKLNEGTRFRVIVPLSVAIIDIFSFTCAGHTFAIPVSAVDELADIAPDAVSGSPDPNREGVVRLFKHRGSTLPLFALSSLLGLPPAQKSRPKAIIVKRNNTESVAFEVDSMIGQQDVVMRALRDPLVDVDGVAGSADLGDGRPTLVLDFLALLSKSSSRGGKVVAA